MTPDVTSGRASRDLTPSFFAEFLEPLSPASLGLLDQPTSVGYRYGLAKFYPPRELGGGTATVFSEEEISKLPLGCPAGF